MSLAQLIDPGLIFARPLGFTSTEHAIELKAYIKQITMSQKQFDQQRQELHQVTTQFTLPQGTHSYMYWANLVCSFVFIPVILILVSVNCCRLRNLQQKSALMA